MLLCALFISVFKHLNERDRETIEVVAVLEQKLAYERRRIRITDLSTVIGDYVMVGMVMTAIDQQVLADRQELLPKG